MVLVVAAVGLPLAGGCLTALFRQRLQPVLGLVSAVLTTAAAVGLAGQVWSAGAFEARFAGPAGLELAFVADGLSVVMVAMTGVVGLFASAFAAGHHRAEPGSGHVAYWPLWLLLWAGVHTLFLANDLFTIYLMLELVAVAGAALVVLGGDHRTTLAGTRYFFAEFAASATFLLGVALLWGEAGTVVLSALPDGAAATTGGRVGLAVMTAGLLLKVPLFPLHFWLPAAHSLAPSTVSPILSAVVVKTSFAVVIRLWFIAMPDAVTPGAAQLLGALGAAAIVWGSVNALRVGSVKLLIAHSTVAQLGFMFLLPPMVWAGAWGGWSGGIVQAVAHGLAKAAALMAAAVFVRAAPGGDVADLGGTAVRRPIATFAFGVAGVSLVGLPPSGGFVAKWYLLVGSFQTGQWWWAPVIVLGSLLTAAYLMRVIKRAFAPAPAGAQLHPERDRREVIALLLALAAFGLGLRPIELLELLAVGAPVVGPGGG
jgi:multicomponent Na+:H+ antiporter subunit D